MALIGEPEASVKKIACTCGLIPLYSDEKKQRAGYERARQAIKSLRNKPELVGELESQVREAFAHRKAAEESRRRQREEKRKQAEIRKKTKGLKNGDPCPASLQGIWPDDPRWPRDGNNRPLQLIGWDSCPGRHYLAQSVTAMGYADPEYPVKPIEFRKKREENAKKGVNYKRLMRECEYFRVNGFEPFSFR
ncbi:hypothetical protein [Desulfoscipio geothermicus]|nr:hypothetical protein [Desulfoscipio geothermicus]